MIKILCKLQNDISKDITTIINELDVEKLILYILQDREYLFSPILRNVSGLNIDDVAIRDIYSLERILEAGFFEIGQLSDDEEKKEIINNEKIYYWENKKSFQECDLINYHSENSRFFELFERMILETTREYSYNKYILRDQIFSSDLSVDQLDKIKKKLKLTTELTISHPDKI
jgi:hypothetical protein